MSKKTFGLNIPVVLGLLFIAITGLRTISTPQIWSHLALGHTNAPLSYVEQQLVNTTWLYDKLAFLVWNIGKAPLLTLLNIVGLLATFILLIQIAKKWGGPLCQGFALLIAGHLIFQGLDVGPEVIMVLNIALFVYLLNTLTKTSQLFAILVPLQILWTNMHGSFLYGPLLTILFAIEAIQREKNAKRTKKKSGITSSTYGMLAAALFVATLINPYFFKTHIQVIAEIKSPQPVYYSSLLIEFFQCPPLKPLILFSMVLGAAGLITLKKRLPTMLTTVAIYSAFLVWTSPRMALLFSALAFPFMVLSFNSISEQLMNTLRTVMGKSAKHLQPITAGILIALLLISIGGIVTNQTYAKTGSASKFGLGMEEKLYPSGIEKIINDPAFPPAEKTLNLPADGGYLAFHYPNRKVLIDYRSGRYSEELIDDITAVIRGEKTSCTGMKDDVEAMIINTLDSSAAEGIAKLLKQGRLVLGNYSSYKDWKNKTQWNLTYFDGTTAILIRNSEEQYGNIINNTEIQKEGLEKLEAARKKYATAVEKGALFSAGNSPEVVGAAKVFLALGQYKEAKSLFALLLKNRKDVPSAWIGLGESQLQLGIASGKGLEEATTYLKTATTLLPNSPQAWFAYSAACKKYAESLENPGQKSKWTAEAQQAGEKAKALAEKFKEEAEAQKKEKAAPKMPELEPEDAPYTQPEESENNSLMSAFPSDL